MSRGFTPTAVRVGAAAVALFAVDVVMRLLLWWLMPERQTELLPGFYVLGAVLVLAAVFAYLWIRHDVTLRVAGRMCWVLLVASALIALLAPLASNQDPLEFGVWPMMGRFLVAAVAIAVGAAIGMWVAITLGVDLTGRVWKAQADRGRARRRTPK